ncbi:hypothetical protein JZ751_024144 [Albula glossodonta]|uniref:Uncharacterized protein n=1 Tax=Albula glossodonta TaxID=121402 RepID=A0A8T2NF13_9TELE|nr:hypothetical protein JZ751_024144 [Albula glossodonta]
MEQQLDASQPPPFALQPWNQTSWVPLGSAPLAPRGSVECITYRRRGQVETGGEADLSSPGPPWRITERFSRVTYRTFAGTTVRSRIRACRRTASAETGDRRREPTLATRENNKGNKTSSDIRSTGSSAHTHQQIR